MFRCGLLWIVLGLLIWPSVSFCQESGVFVLADGGMNCQCYPYNSIEDGENANKDLKLTVELQNSSRLSHVSGSVTHPYGEGPFEVEIAAADIITHASISTFADRVNFEIQLTTEIHEERVVLFSAKPIPNNTETHYSLNREGSFQFDDSYPYPIEWLDLMALDTNGNAVLPAARTQPVLTLQDVFFYIGIDTTGFPEEVESISVSVINGIELFYPLVMVKDSRFNDYDFSLSSVMKGIVTEEGPLTFDVVLVDGSRYVIEKPNQYRFTLSPPTAVGGWMHYGR